MTGTLDELFNRRLQQDPAGVWLKYGTQLLSAGDLATNVDELCSDLGALGLQPGERVGIYMSKSPGLVIALLACSRLRLVAIPIHTVLKVPQLSYVLEDAAASALITDEKRLPHVEPVLKLRGLVGVFGYRESPCSEFVCRELSGAVRAEGLPEVFSSAELIIYTSGSTGRPKGVVFSANNIRQGAVSVSTYLQLQPADCLLALLPFAFDYGFNQLTSSLASGASLVLMDFFLAADVVRQVALHNVTVIAGVPALWLKLLQPEWGGAVNSVRLLTNSGGRLPKATQAALLQIFQRADLVLMYGLTEAFRSTWLEPGLRESCPDSIGRAIPAAEILVIDENGQQTEDGEVGELVHCGPLVTLGYWNNPDATAERFRQPPASASLVSENGCAVWSGDLVYRDAQGLLYFVGRNDGLIKVSGYRVSAEDVEEAVYGIGEVGEAVAVGVDDPTLGQQIVLVVSGTKLSGQQIIQHLRRQLPEYMVPAKVYQVEELPRTPSGKFDRVAIKATVI